MEVKSDVLKKASEEMTKANGNDATSIVNDIISAAKPTRKTVNEKIWKDMYSDFFTGKDVSKNDPRGDMWIEVAGGVHNPVDIVNDDGSVIDTVPPISGKISINQDAVKAVGGQNIGTKHAAIKASNPLDAAVYQNNIARTIGNATDVKDISNEWNDFFSRNKNKEGGLVDAIKKSNETTNDDKVDTSKLIIE